MVEALVFYNENFENEVRRELNVNDRPIYAEDVLKVLKLDLDGFYFDIRDCDTLSKFKNLTFLQIDFNFNDISFLDSLSSLNELNIQYCGNVFDFKYLSNLSCLKNLTVSGGCLSNMKLENLEMITHIDNLEILMLHEFGYVDLSPLKKMQQLKDFFCGWGNKIDNYDSIGDLSNLEFLTLADVEIENIDFLKQLPDTVTLDLCGINFTKDIDVSIFDRFYKKSICEIIINNERVFFEDDYL